MKYFTLAAVAAFATGSLANTISNPFSPVPGYPLGNGFCLTDDQANFIVKDFASALMNTNRNASVAALNLLIADTFSETSDSIDTLAGRALGTSSFSNKTAYITSVSKAPPTPPFTTQQVFHDCTNIAWRWIITGLARNIGEVKGINAFVANPLTGQISQNNLEFNSIMWGLDIGWTCTPPA